MSKSDFLTSLSNPARNALVHVGITTITKLATYTEREILAIHGVGPASLPSLKRSLAAAGLSFRVATPKKADPAEAKAKPAAGQAEKAEAAKAAKPAKATATAKRPGGAMFQKIAFTMFSVTDATRARAFYEGVLGFTRGLASPDGTWTEYDLPGGGCLALFRHPDPKARRQAGGASVAFEVADLDALNVRLAAAGVKYQGGVIHGPHCRMSNVLDSEGNGIILHERARDENAKAAKAAGAAKPSASKGTRAPKAR